MSSTERPVLNDRYELQQRIGRGGMADVFLARDLLLDRPVAIKVLFPEFAADPSFVERFRREAQAAANLNHPNIVGVYDWGRYGTTYFMAMEFVQGRTLADILRANSKLTPNQASDVAIEVAAALGFAHRNGVVHRDVKPANILIGHDGRVKVADFGIARALNSAAEQDLTQAGSVMGTATYFSPEQAQGAQPDPRSDLYSLGIVLYEMVSGKPPFSGENPVAIAYKQVHNAPQPLNQLVPGIPRPFEAVVAKLLAKNPAIRYPNAEALRDDLRRFKDGQPVAALAGTGGGGAGGAAAAAGAAAAVVLGGGGAAAAAAGNGASGPPTGAADVVPARAAAPSAPPAERPSQVRPVPMAPVPTSVATRYVPAAGATPAGPGYGAPPTTGGYYEAPRRTSGIIIFAFVVLAALVAGGIFLYQNLSKDDPTDTAAAVQVQVPEVRGVTLEEARKILSDAGLVAQEQAVADPNTQPNYVYDQSPTPDQLVDEGSTVIVTYNPDASTVLIDMPNVQGLSYEDAVKSIKAAGLDPNKITRTDQEDKTAKAGTVLLQSPAKAEKVAADTAIALTVATSPTKITVPTLANTDGIAADQALRDLGFTTETVQEISDTVAKGLVIRTEPAAGTSLNTGTKVRIVVSSGKAQVSVPNLEGFSENQARQALQDLELKTKVGDPIDLPAGDPRDGKVVLQNPTKDTKVDKGTTITIRIGKAAAAPPPSTTTTTTTTTTTVVATTGP